MDINGKRSRRNTFGRRCRYYRLKIVRKLRRFAPHHTWHWILIVVIMFPVAMFYGCNKLTAKTKSEDIAKVPVLAAPVIVKDMPIYISALGTVTPINTVTVKTQIEGQLLKVHFPDGAIVKQGDLLAEVDPRPYQAQLIQYQGQLEHDKALLVNARIDLERYKTLFAQDSISEQTLATQVSLVKQYEGTVKADRGQIDTVKVNLNYCQITAPITGRLGIFSVDIGNVVQVSDTTGIVTINTMDPIYVDFSIPEDDLPRVAEKLSLGDKLKVYAQDRSQNKTLSIGFLLTTDNQIDTSTGTIKLRSQFENTKQILFPNQFVNIKLLIDTVHNATVIPTAAVQYGTNGTFVFVLNSDDTVSLKPVMVITTEDDETAVTGDISRGQKLITEGTDKLKDGTAVTVLQQDNGNIGQNNSEPI